MKTKIILKNNAKNWSWFPFVQYSRSKSVIINNLMLTKTGLNKDMVSVFHLLL
jgi:hypothetical protein